MTLRISPMSIVFTALFIGLPLFLWTQGELFTKLFSGVPGLFAITAVAFIANLTILLPAPALGVTMPIVAQIAEQNGLLLVSALYAGGSAFGELSGYLAGRKGAGIPFLGDSRWHQTLERWLYGNRTDIALVVFSAFPIILPFDVGGMIAGSIRHPWWRFLLSTFLGRWLKYVVLIQVWQIVTRLSGYLEWIVFFCILVGIFITAWWYRKALLGYWTRIRANGIRLEFSW